jgi:hypothetical protein
MTPNSERDSLDSWLFDYTLDPELFAEELTRRLEPIYAKQQARTPKGRLVQAILRPFRAILHCLGSEPDEDQEPPPYTP